jgi:hypothetical protein
MPVLGDTEERTTALAPRSRTSTGRARSCEGLACSVRRRWGLMKFACFWPIFRPSVKFPCQPTALRYRRFFSCTKNALRRAAMAGWDRASLSAKALAGCVDSGRCTTRIWIRGGNAFAPRPPALWNGHADHRSADANLKPFCRVDSSTLHCLILRLAF